MLDFFKVMLLTCLITIWGNSLSYDLFPKQPQKKNSRMFTPLKINMEHNHGGLENHVPF